MSTDISAFGIRVQIFASVTFPAGITITQFADDGDSLDVPQQQIADKAMGVNGDLITWSKANPLNLTLNIIPASDDDRNMSVMLEANRVARGKRGARDVITLTAIQELIYDRFEIQKVLVIAPKRVAEDTWTREHEK